MCVISVTFLDITGDDYKGEVAQNDKELPSKVLYVRSAPLRSVLKALGLSLGATLFSGARYVKLHDAPRAGTTLCFPYATPRITRFK